ncbi:MAG: hypothetical protein FWH38_03830 [Treponema sp.]|nr:hypothetical protein [Treponema sp.]
MKKVFAALSIAIFSVFSGYAAYGETGAGPQALSMREQYASGAGTLAIARAGK